MSASKQNAHCTTNPTTNTITPQPTQPLAPKHNSNYNTAMRSIRQHWGWTATLHNCFLHLTNKKGQHNANPTFKQSPNQTVTVLGFKPSFKSCRLRSYAACTSANRSRNRSARTKLSNRQKSSHNYTDLNQILIVIP
jgi:hypothetical protein